MRKKLKSLLSKLLVVSSISLGGFCALTSVGANVAAAAETMGRGIYFEIDKNPIEKVEIVAEKEALEVQRTEKVGLTVAVYPSNAANTIIKTTYRIVDGKEYATIQDGALCVGNDAAVGASIEVKASVDGVESENSLVFTVVETPVEAIEITSEETEIQLGGALWLSAKVYPENATDQYVNYSIVAGGEYAKISYNGILSCTYNPSIEEGSVITVRASSVSDPTIYCEKTLTICKPVLDSVEISWGLCSVEQQRTYVFNMEKEPYATIFGGKAVYYSVDVDASIATIDLTGRLYIEQTAPIGSKITVRVEASDGTHLEHELEVVPVYATAFFPMIATAPSLQWNEQGYYLPGDVIRFSVEAFQPINVSDMNKVYELSISDESIAYVDGDTIVINDAESITQNNPCLTVMVSSAVNNLSQMFDIFVYIPVTEVNVEQKTLTVKENNSYALDELFAYSAAPLNSMPRSVKYEISGVTSKIAEIKDGKLIVHNDLPAGEIKVGICVDVDGIRSETIYFDVYKPTRSVKLSASNLSPMSAKSEADTVTIYAAVSKTASVNHPEIRILQGEAYIDGEITYVGLTEQGLAKWEFTLKKDLAHAEVNGGLTSIRVDAEQDGIVSAFLELEIYVPDEDLVASSAWVQRGNSYAMNFVHTPNASNWDAECRVSKVVSKSGEVLKTSVTIDASNKIFVPKNLSVGDQIFVEYRASDGRFCGEWKEVIYTVDRLSEKEATTSKLVYNNGNKATFGFNIVYTMDNGKDKKVVIGKNNTLPQLHVGRTTDIYVYYRGDKLSAYGMSIKEVLLVGENAEQVATISKLESDSFTVAMDKDAAGNSKVQFLIRIQDGEEVYGDINAGTLYCFRPMSGTLVFKTVTVNNCKMSGLIDAEKSKSTFDYTATNGVSSLEFTLLGDDDKNGILKVNSYVANQKQWIRYSYMQEYNAEQIPYQEETELLLKTVAVDNEGGSGGVDYVIALSNMTADSLGASLPTKSGYDFIGYCSGKNDSGTKYFDGSGNCLNANFSGTLYAAWLKKEATVDLSGASGHRDKRITDSDKYSETIYPSLDREKLKAYGYTKLEVKIKFDAKEYDDGYQELWLYSPSGKEIGYKEFEHSPGTMSSSWKSLSKTFTISLNDVQTDGSIKLKWGAHGWWGDDWSLGHTVITFTAIKA